MQVKLAYNYHIFFKHFWYDWWFCKKVNESQVNITKNVFDLLFELMFVPPLSPIAVSTLQWKHCWFYQQSGVWLMFYAKLISIIRNVVLNDDNNAHEPWGKGFFNYLHYIRSRGLVINISENLNFIGTSVENLSHISSF